MKFISKNKKGFTLVETLVAVSVLLVAVAAVFTAAQSGLSSSTALRHRIVASYLAEEAINGVKNIKDSNLLHLLHGESVSWIDGISSCQFSTPCGYDVIGNGGSGSLSACTSIDSCRIKMGAFSPDTTIIYRQMSASLNSGTTDTGFVRKMWIEETLPGKEAKLTVVISRPGTSFKDITIESFMYNFWPTI